MRLTTCCSLSSLLDVGEAIKGADATPISAIAISRIVSYISLYYTCCYNEPMEQAPDFTLNDSNGDSHSLADYAGKWLVIYFYPKDDTPGCTIEACSFRDARDDIAALGTQVIGISKDEASSHDKFMEKHKLNFVLLSDPDASVMLAYGAWGKKMFGKEGALRKTFIINPEGKIVKTFGRVTPMGHGDQVVATLKELQDSK